MVCVTSSDRLNVTRGGTHEAPVIYSGNGQTPVAGITVKADNVIVQGFKIDRAKAPAIEVTGKNITVRDNTVTAPSGGDGDAIRFYGDDQNILHNTLDTTGSNSGGHNDCMQTFTSGGGPPTSNLLVDGNDCHAKHQCIMAEGPGDVGDGGGGPGEDKKWTITNNICDSATTAQDIMLQYIDDVTITGNQFSGRKVDHAVGLTKCKNYTVEGNKIGNIKTEVNPNDT